MTKIDFDNINDAIVYDIFQVEGNEGEALNDIYLELFELLGRDAMLKIYTHFHGDKINDSDIMKHVFLFAVHLKIHYTHLLPVNGLFSSGKMVPVQ